MKKSIILSTIVLISSIILSGVCFILFSQVTYSGIIVSSNSMDDYVEFTVKDEKTNEQITILVDIHTYVHYCHHERDIYLGDLMNSLGSTVEVTCKRFFNHNKYAESIVVQFDHKS